jgi:hypothetical protein
MATHDYVIDNQTSANARADINNVLQAILTNNSSPTPPTVTNANMFWYDTANNVLKMRNAADSGTGGAGWIIVAYLDQTNGSMQVRSDVIQAASSGGIDVKDSSGSTIIDLNIASQATAEAGTDTTQLMSPQRTKQAIDANTQTFVWKAVGTYALGWVNGTQNGGPSLSTSEGQTVSGTIIYPVNLYGNADANLSTEEALGGYGAVYRSNPSFGSGSWRRMGPSSGAGSSPARIALYLRIS